MKKWWYLLGAAAVTFWLLPNVVAGLIFARGDELGKAALPCLCCLDVRVPEVSPWFLLVALIVIVGIFFLMAWIEGREEERRKKEQKMEEEKQHKKWEEDCKKWPWLKGKSVEFAIDDKKINGVVVEQYEDNLTVNWMDKTGKLQQSKRKVDDVKLLEGE